MSIYCQPKKRQQQERAHIRAHIQQFLNRGGRIQRLPSQTVPPTRYAANIGERHV